MQQDALLDLLIGSLEMKTLVAIAMQREASAEKILITRAQQAAVDMEQIRIEEAEEEDQLIPKDPSIVQPADLEQEEEVLSEDRPEALPLQCPIATEGGKILSKLQRRTAPWNPGDIRQTTQKKDCGGTTVYCERHWPMT